MIDVSKHISTYLHGKTGAPFPGEEEKIRKFGALVLPKCLRQGPDEGWVSPTVSGKEIVVKARGRCRQRMSKQGESV